MKRFVRGDTVRVDTPAGVIAQVDRRGDLTIDMPGGVTVRLDESWLRLGWIFLVTPAPCEVGQQVPNDRLEKLPPGSVFAGAGGGYPMVVDADGVHCTGERGGKLRRFALADVAGWTELGDRPIVWTLLRLGWQS